MILKTCEYCGKEIITKYKIKIFCNASCQRKHYNRRPEIREKYRLRIKEYRKTHPEWKEKHRLDATTKYRQKRANYWKEYGRRPEIREKIRKKEKFRRQTDPQFLIRDRLRRSLNNAFKKYSKIGKIMSSKKYGINWEKVIESLKPFPENIKAYEIDHILPLHSFNLDDLGQIKKAFAPENLQWLTIEDNRKKGGKVLKSYNNKLLNNLGIN